MFKLEPQYQIADIEAAVMADVEEWFQSLVSTLREKGKKAVDAARAKTKVEGGFNNLTWNLRASIGMCLVYKGKIIETYFPPIGNGPHGAKIGPEMAEKIAVYSRDKDGILLVVVAAEEYAVWVQTEAMDVLWGSTDKMIDEVTAVLL